jgi:hypothetical protein
MAVKGNGGLEQRRLLGESFHDETSFHWGCAADHAHAPPVSALDYIGRRQSASAVVIGQLGEALEESSPGRSP